MGIVDDCEREWRLMDRPAAEDVPDMAREARDNGLGGPIAPPRWEGGARELDRERAEALVLREERESCRGESSSFS